jgi:hypothetical protein
MRLAIPNLEAHGQIHQTGIGLLNLFGVDLFMVIDEDLKDTDDPNWLTNYRKTSLVYLNYNFNDPSNLLKELLRNSSSPLRKTIRNRIEQRDLVAFYHRLQIILDDRNDWIHHNSSFSKESLKTLILNIYPIAQKMKLALTVECDSLLMKLDGVEPDITQSDIPIVADSPAGQESELLKDLKQVLIENEQEIGELIEGKFLDYSYVLHLTGEIRNRKNSELLSQVNPEFSESLGALLIARKPNGGRLRIMEDGTLVAYFEDHWGYLAQIKPEQWFPGHIFHQV